MKRRAMKSIKKITEKAARKVCEKLIYKKRKDKDQGRPDDLDKQMWGKSNRCNESNKHNNKR